MGIAAEQASPAPAHQRLVGVDLARGVALLGMLAVNLRLAMGVAAEPGAAFATLFLALEGRSAALFVCLAGLGLGLATARLSPVAAQAQTWRRALFLATVGLLHLSIFAADILHYYGAYFVLGGLLLRWPRRRLGALALGLPLLYLGLLFVFDYSKGWNWQTLDYVDLWSVPGFLRHLVFNGMHPILPWLSFFIWGLLLAGSPLGERRWQHSLILGGLAGFAFSLGLHSVLLQQFPAAAGVLSTKPLPPGPLYIGSAAALSSAIIGLMLRFGPNLNQPLHALAQLGRCTLSLYLAHVLIGMGILEAIGWLDGQRSLTDVALAWAVFVVVALLSTRLWLARFAQGPVEMLMRRCCG
ncbi:DUF418 domain-containing protein [Paucibacter sp. APW11]|uniref:DUF418 domain-containing protein n=1 Tax=Roseateles aquae TaxID=3077235 RepID=A0ABU3PDD8_9BURK|nr:DUF418 domain-containing protein [Paucibacter sp. APW11]MDT9000615.1 DUF418 domain-containing protein [Paucibacter sp. APW11]